MADHKRIQVRNDDCSVIDSEFNNIRERFDSEMRRMEDEMTRFRSELMSRESPFPQRSSLTSSFPAMLTQHSNAFNSADSHQQLGNSSSIASLPAAGDNRAWLDNIDSPLIKNEGDQKHLKLRFDVSQYKPEEIIVKTVDNKLLVHAKHEEKSDCRSVYREYNREFLLPQGTNPELIKSSLSKDGVLTVEAPLPGTGLGAAETRLPITHQ